MEYVERSHKDVPFGWLLSLQDFMRATRARRLSSNDEPNPSPELPAGLDQLSRPC
jgi:hypothetical protein